MSEPIKLAVRQTAAFLLQSGSIDNRFGGADRAVQGSRIHRKLQKEAGADYRAEVSLALTMSFCGQDYLLYGRADGVIEGEPLTVDEIKTTGTPLELIDEDFDAAHWGQALCYAHILAVSRDLPAVGIRLTYYNVDSDQIKRFYRQKTAGELQDFMADFLGQYQRWARFKSGWQESRTQSIKALSFPFPRYRPGQREMSAAAYRGIQRGLRIFCQAPTGIGKTLSSLFPAVKAMGESLCEKIFYLTAKTTTRQTAEEACRSLMAGGLRLKTVTLTAKDKVCFLPERNCNPEACPYADGYYDRARQAVYSLIEATDLLDRAAIEAGAREHRVCPFELALDLSLWCDALICDYNYLFDPVVSLQRFFGDKGGDYAFLIDEAHNLADRARDMYSAPLSRQPLMALKKALGKGRDPLRRSVRALCTRLLEARAACGDRGFTTQAQPDEALVLAVKAFGAAASEWLEAHREPTELRAQVLSLFFEAGFFQRILELYGDNYCCFTEKKGSDCQVKLLCADPAPFLDSCLSKGRSALFFSATLSPLPYYRDLLGGGGQALCFSLDSPFKRENLCLLCAPGISTKYADRPDSLEPIAQLLKAFISEKRGNYLVYFPSYKYLLEVYGVFTQLYPQIDTLLQTGSMDEEAREAFLRRFDGENPHSLLGFCVLGGIFSEGVDLKGDRLIGTAIIGVGLPQIGPELDFMRDYFNKSCGMGYEYVYRYPGMNKVLQAAGRVIRGEEDRGAVLLIDDRLPTRNYQALFPPHWQHWQRVHSPTALGDKLRAFWGAPEQDENTSEQENCV